MFKQQRTRLLIVILLVFSLSVILFPALLVQGGRAVSAIKIGNVKTPENVGAFLIKIGETIKDRYRFRLGLDLQGGSQLVYLIETDKVPADDRQRALDSLQSVIEARVNGFGVAEAVVFISKRSNGDYLVVELPGVKNLDEALELIGKTAELEFREQDPTGNFSPATPPLTGKHLKRATPSSDPQTSLPIVEIEFTDEGAKLFQTMTARNLKKPIGIFLDGQIVSAPTVQNEIAGGQAVITGMESPAAARTLSIQLSAGALPVPIQLEENRTVDATLGSESIKKSLLAGVIGLVAVMLYMTAYYRLPGILASAALLMYVGLTLVIFNGILGFILPFTPVTLTLAGIAGFILSIGMAVDANILIFERVKDELRDGRSLTLALEAGFSRAWNSIRDSNVSSLITTGILYTVGTGVVRGFAVALGIGIVVSMFTAIFVSRTLLRGLLSLSFIRRRAVFGVRVPQ